MSHKQPRQFASEQKSRRQLSPRALRGVAGLTIAAVSLSAVAAANRHHHSPEFSASFLAERIQTTGRVENGLTVTFGPGTKYRSTPAIVPTTEDQTSNVVGEIPKDEELRDTNPIVITGNDNREYVVTVAPGSHDTSPSSIDELSREAVVFPLLDGEQSWAPGTEDQEPIHLFEGSDIPAGASLIHTGYRE